MPEVQETKIPEQSMPVSGNSSLSKTDQIHELVNFLVTHYQEISRFPSEHRKGIDIGGEQLKVYANWLEDAHTHFREVSDRDLALTPASEWVLDNYYIIRHALQQISEDLPAGFYKQLPKLAENSLVGLPRIYAIGRLVLFFQNYAINVMDLQTILLQVQDRLALTMGELWALPIFLRYNLIETLGHVLETIIHPQTSPGLPVFPSQLIAFGNNNSVNLNDSSSTSTTEIVANIILSLRSIDELNWNDFFEAVSKLELTLREDPAGIYPLMDFKSRDLYRKEIEALSFASDQEEIKLAETILDLANERNHNKAEAAQTQPGIPLADISSDDPLPHVGEYLIGTRRSELEARIGYSLDVINTFKRWGLKHAGTLYLGSIFILSLLFLGLIFILINPVEIFRSSSPLARISFLALTIAALVPISTASVSLVNWAITLKIKPRILPKLLFTEEIPEPFKTLVVMPALISSHSEVDYLIRQLEMNFLRNPEPGLSFALLTDFTDADSESQPVDEELVSYAKSAIKNLNLKYIRSTTENNLTKDRDPRQVNQAGSPKPDERTRPAIMEGEHIFYLLHRKRQWNQSERRWMGWERKRGKLHELNRLLRGDMDTSFSTFIGSPMEISGLRNVRYVITLDADTILPHNAARRLVGTMAHPLNYPVFNKTTGQIISGYSILQPRMEIHPRSANYSWFTRIFAGDTGLDLYTRAVSDAYQDLFGEGSYVGKGIYDIDAFERSVDKHIPENSVLSHDLLEGIMGRAGLVTDITMVEDYPSNFIVQIKRQQRWIRGDWQLLPFLIRPGKFSVKFTAIDRWKIIDNLLRSMLAPSLLFILFIGAAILPGLIGLWLAILLLSLGVPVFTTIVRSATQTLGGEGFRAAVHPLRWSFLRWLLAIAFLPYEAYNDLDAIITTLYRLLISHRNLLQWTTAAQTARIYGLQAYRNTTWFRMVASTIMSLFLAVVIQLVYSNTRTGVSPGLLYSLPIFLVWIFSPAIAQRIGRPIKLRTNPLSIEQSMQLRQVARRTWGYFERFVGPEDHWLPPDHFQESPVGIIAHQTSPSNIGLLLTSTLAAYDLGYLDQLGLSTRLSITLNTLEQLERFNGHFYNWYDTLTLQPLKPRYISTVDSGNLAASLIVTAQACKSMPSERIFRWDLWQGYLDSLFNLTEIISGMQKPGIERLVEEISHKITVMSEKILVVRTDPYQWFALFQIVNGQFWPDLSKQLIELIEAGNVALDLEALRKLQEVASQIERHHQALQRTLSELVPWIQFLAQVPAFFSQAQFEQALSTLKTNLPYNPRLGQILNSVNSGLSDISELRKILQDFTSNQASGLDTEREAVEWLDAVESALRQAVVNADSLLNNYSRDATRAERLVMEMDFQFLYSPQRRVFHLGFNLDTGQLDDNYYDLLASEARIASIISVAKGDVPESHWIQLSRPLTQVDGIYVLLSWSATMFEYLMPTLFLRSYPGTLLADSAQGVVVRQIAYGKTKGVPWGVSESGFYMFDANQNYQYRAFGVPGLGFKRGLGDDLVITPYASMMAIGYNSQAVAQNLERLIDLHAFGLYGLYESIDFTTDRLPTGSSSAIVHEYMSHHQGMILMSLVNYFDNNIMIRRMHNDPRIQSVELLLQEQMPQSVPLQNPTADNVKGIMRAAVAPVDIDPWSVPVDTSIPIVNFLSNGNYGIMLSNMGGGYSTWRDVDLTRWQADGVLDPWGTWIYIQDLASRGDENAISGKLWSAGFQPIPTELNNIQVTYFAHMAVFHRIENGVSSTMEVTVCPDDPVEIRRIHLHNTTNHHHHLRLTSYGEVILTQQAADRRHPAYNKMFIESEFVSELNLQIFSRRPRSNDEQPIFMGHMLVLNHKAESHEEETVARHESDRNLFIGRGRSLRNPISLESDKYLSGTTGATLDPIFALGQEFKVSPHENIELAYLTFAGDSREAVLALARRYSNWTLIERTYHQADITAQSWLGKQHYDTQTFKNTLKVLSALLYPFKAVRAPSEIIAANKLGQPGLWRFGISGDYPILLVEIENVKQVDLVREVIQIHEFLRSRHFLMDVVILNHQATDYGAEVNGLLYRLVNRLNSEQWLNKRGGIFILYSDQINPEEYTLLQTAGRFIARGDRGTLADQIPEITSQAVHLPEFIPTRPAEAPATPVQEDSLPAIENLLFQNGYGGFSTSGHDYIIEVSNDKLPPAPWVNIIGYPYFGFMVSETGSQCTWAVNSGENRLTPWSNDPVRDPTGEALYLRDEETGEIWTPTPLPAGTNQPYRVIHSAGYTIFEHNSHGLRQRLTLFASPEDPVKIIHLRVENTWNHNRRITATQYIEWALGTTHSASLPYIIPEYDAAEYCLLATNPYNSEFGERAAFLIACKPVHGLTADRAEFLGRGGTLASPAALHRIGLEARLTPSEDLCAVLQLHLDLLPGGVEEIYFVVGQGNNKVHALELAKKYHDSAYVGAALERTRVLWDHLLNTIQVHTPEPATDLILNRWMLYQSLSCRIWGRSAFYQPSGAFGFRDQLQDVLALLPIDPVISRGQILNAAQFQFLEGDVMHWWHPPSGRGVRTRISDDLLWLPYVTALYIETTGDVSILEEKIPFLDAPPLNMDENERYNQYPPTKESYTLLDHCHRALKKGATIGSHGLPLIGTGDWNDALNRVGVKGKGESVWLAWFLFDVLDRFAKICEDRGEKEVAEVYRSQAKEYAAAIEQAAWDGSWYRRGFYDDGFPLGSIQDSEGQIDAIAQSWSVLSGAGDPDRSRKAMQSVLERLVLPQDRLSLLITPPFNNTERDPGYIKGYYPGIRENGGQYSHAAVWTAWAFAVLGDGKQAGELFDMLNPIFHSDSEQRAAEYRVEPYVMASDIYSKPPHLHRGGWTWYTGSAAWMYRLGLITLLGFKKTGNTLRIDPVIPPTWDGFEIDYLFGAASYRIKVSNPQHLAHQVKLVKLDGKVLEDHSIPLMDDGRDHIVEVTMGNLAMPGSQEGNQDSQTQ